MKTQEARDLGNQLGEMILASEVTLALQILKPTLDEKIPFRILGRIGESLGNITILQLFPFLDLLANTDTQGGWVIIGTALGESYSRDPRGVMDRCNRYIILGDTWYATDLLGERVPGPALVADFHQAHTILTRWRGSSNRWVRRAVGVAVHFWAKRSRGDLGLQWQATELLALLKPMFDEWDIAAVKGIGWGLKTIGKMYPDLLTEWLGEQAGRRSRAIMLRKALTYLPPDQKNWVQERFDR